MTLEYEFEKAALEFAKAIEPLGYRLCEFCWGFPGPHVVKFRFDGEKSVRDDIRWREEKLRELAQDRTVREQAAPILHGPDTEPYSFGK
jgi:hypothetical protein